LRGAAVWEGRNDRRSRRDWADWHFFAGLTDIAVRSPFLRIVLLAGLILTGPVMAGGLYSGEAPVASQSEGERNEALKTAFAQVITKVSGDNAILTRPEVAKAVAAPGRYVQQYQYRQDVANDNGQPQVHLTLLAQFDRDAVDQLIGGAAKSGSDATAITDTRTQSYRIWVSGIASADDYARLVGTLGHNDLVRAVQAEQARGDGVELRIDTVGPLQRVLDSLGNGPIRVSNAKPPVEGVDALLDMRP
jgi:hypothetical protein